MNITPESESGKTDEQAPAQPPRFASRKTWLDLLLVLVLLAVATLILVDFSGLTIRRLGARHAAATLDFHQRHQFFDVQYNHARYECKLPFPFWLMSVPVFLLGSSDMALRVVSELFGMGLVLMTYCLGKKLFNRTVGFFAALAAVINVLHPWVVRHSLIDTSAHFLIGLAVVFFYLGWQNPERRKLYVFLFYAASAVATWHRGPLGFVLPGITVTAVLVPLGQWRTLRQFLNPLAILMWLVLVVPYFLALGWNHLDQTFITENLLHFIQGEASHDETSSSRPPYYWPVMFLFRYLPWSGFFLLSLVYAAKRRVSPDRSALWFVAAWFGSWFLFWHLAAARNETYLLALVIPTSLFVGYLLAGLWRSAGTVVDSTAKEVWVTFSFVALVATAAGMPLAMLMTDCPDFSMLMWGGVTGALALLGLAVVILALMLDYRRALVVGLCLSVVSLVVVGFFVNPAVDQTRPGREFFTYARELVGNRPVVIYGSDKLGRLSHEFHSIVLYLRSPHPVTVLSSPAKIRKKWKELRDPTSLTTRTGLAVFSPEGGRKDLTGLKPKVKPVRREDDSGAYLLYSHPKPRNVSQADPSAKVAPHD